MTRKRFVLLAIGTSTVFFAAVLGLLLLATDVEREPARETDDFDLAELTPEQLEAIGRRRIEAMAAASSSYVALREEYGDEGIAKVIMGISALGDEDLGSEGSDDRAVIVIEIDTLDGSAE